MGRGEEGKEEDEGGKGGTGKKWNSELRLDSHSRPTGMSIRHCIQSMHYPHSLAIETMERSAWYPLFTNV